jgi:hypothetical protein
MTKERETFTASVEKLLGDSFMYEDFLNDPELEDLETPSLEPYEDDEGNALSTTPDDDGEADPDTYDQYVGAEVVLPIGDTMMNAKVRGRKRQLDGTLMGKAHSNKSSILERMRSNLWIDRRLNSPLT